MLVCPPLRPGAMKSQRRSPQYGGGRAMRLMVHEALGCRPLSRVCAQDSRVGAGGEDGAHGGCAGADATTATGAISPQGGHGGLSGYLAVAGRATRLHRRPNPGLAWPELYRLEYQPTAGLGGL